MPVTGSDLRTSRRRTSTAADGAQHVLALDIGTSSVKALMFDPAHCRWWSARERCRALFDAGVVEVPATEWWRATRAATKEVLTMAGLPARAVGHVAVTGNMSSVVLLGPKGRSERNAILLADSRGEAEVAAMPSRVRRRIADLSGNPIGPSFTLAKLLWLAANEQDNMSAARVWLAAKDYVRNCLTGTVGTDPSDAFNSLLIDPETLDWRRDLIAAAGLDQEKFPVVRPGTEVAGSVSVRAARATGLVAGTPVLTGLGDMAALANSVTGVDGLAAVVSLGTSTTVLLPITNFGRPPQGFSVHPVLPGSPWFFLASLLTGGLALDWLRRLGPIAVTPADRARSLVFLPQLSGSGSPCFDPRWRGTVLGLDPSVGLGEMARALFEAIAFEMRTCIEALGAKLTGPLVVAGGGSAITEWDQVVADVLGVPVEVLRIREASAFGAALLAFDSGRAAELSVRARRSRVIEPRGDWDPESAYDRYMAARRLVAEFYERSHSGRHQRRSQ